SLSASNASAQTIHGSFTLSHEIHWQSVTLPAGDYTFSTSSPTGNQTMLVRGPTGPGFQLHRAVSHAPHDKPKVLVLERRGYAFCVRELDLNDIGLQITYSMPKFPKSERELAQGPASTERVLIALAK